jgi:CheY-like chemotaxis protein
VSKDLRKILFIDDDQDIHLIVKLSLRAIPNLEMCSALSGEEGIKIAMEFQPDLILLDVMMPKMDGIVTLQMVKLLPSLANTPVIFVTAKAQKDEIEEYFKHGVLDVIVKPFTPAIFTQNILKIWNGYQNQLV